MITDITHRAFGSVCPRLMLLFKNQTTIEEVDAFTSVCGSQAYMGGSSQTSF